MRNFTILALVLALSQSGCGDPQPEASKEIVAHIRQLLEQGDGYLEHRKYAEALTTFHEALLAVAGTDDPLLNADVYYQIGRTQQYRQRYREALDAYQTALTLVKKSGTLPDQALLFNTIGAVYEILGEIEAARTEYLQALDIRREVGDQAGEARTLLNLGSTYLTQGQYPKALENYKAAQALTAAIKPPPQREISAIYTHLGSLYAELGQYDKALDFHRRAMAIYQHEGDQSGVAASWHNIGFTYAERHDYTEAITAYKKAVSIREELGDDFRRAETLNNLGLALHDAKQPSEALKVLEQALQVLEALNTRKEVAATLDSIGTVYSSLGNDKNAIDSYSRSLAIWHELGSRDGERITLGNIASAFEQQGKLDAAILFYKLSINTSQAIRRDLRTLSKSDQRAYVGRVEGFYRRLADLLMDNGWLAEAEQVLAMLKEEEFFEFIRRRSDLHEPQITSASLTTSENAWAERYAAINRNLVSLGQEYEALKGRQQVSLSPTEARRLEALASDMQIARQAYRAFIIEIEAEVLSQGRERSKEFGEKGIKTLKQVQAELKRLGPGAVLIHYFMTDQRLRLLLTTPEQQLQRDSPIEARELNRLIGRFRQALQDPHSDPLPLAKDLYQQVLEPLEADLRQADAKMLLVSLDDTLRYLPFAALHDGNRYLIERFAPIVYTAAARSHLTTPPQPSWRVAGLGFSGGADDFAPLPAVRRELDGIVREEGRDDSLGVLPGVIEIDEDFTAGHLSDNLRAGYPVVHIASHFVFRPGTEIDSYLVLGKGKRLTVADLQDGDFPFTQVDLLTLSACETAVGGRDAHGREIEGLGSVAQQQGAKAVLATLWPVADLSTATFMEGFYRRREQGLTKAEALRQTQLAFLNDEQRNLPGEEESHGRGVMLARSMAEGNGSPPYGHPYYWAAFILMGNAL